MIEWKGKQYYIPKDLSDRLGVSQNTINRWRTTGKLQFIKISERKYLFTNEHIEKLLQCADN